MPVFEPLLHPKRYKGAKGGRGSGKSHFFADNLIERFIYQPDARWVCIREVQLSLKQSVKLLLEDKIRLFGMQHILKPLEDRIVSRAGGLIIFNGMQNHTADSIKSLEGFDGAWIEEAQTISARSLELLRPTIRKPNSELLFSWNPMSPKDSIEKLLVGDKEEPPLIEAAERTVVEANYYDNMMLPKVLYDEMVRDRARDPDKYAHVWLGKYQKLSQARVFRNFRVEDFETPSDARFMFGGDFGFSVDPTVLIRMFIKGKYLFIDYEAYKVGCEADHTPALFAGTDSRGRWQNPYGWTGIPGATRWPMRLDSSNPQMISYLRRQGFENITPSIKGPGSIEEGIEFLKSFDIIIHPRCKHVADEFSTFSYKIDKKTNEVLPELEETKNHTIDSARYGIEPLRRASSGVVVSTYSATGTRSSGAQVMKVR